MTASLDVRRLGYVGLYLGPFTLMGCNDFFGFVDGRPFPDAGMADSHMAADSRVPETDGSSADALPGNDSAGREGGPTLCTPDSGIDSACKCILGSSQACQIHPDMDGKGPCRAGVQTCVAASDGSMSDWGPCMGSVGPAAADTCAVKGDDSNCNGVPNDGCPCLDGDQQPCGPDNPQGICMKGTARCQDRRWGACDAVFPKSRDCTSSADNDCDGKPDNTIDATCLCNSAASLQTCNTHPQDGVGICKAGTQACTISADKRTSSWGECSGSVGPSTRSCTTSADNDCDGKPDDTQIHGSKTFEFTGHEETFVVPSCVTHIDVDAFGAQGGPYDYGTTHFLGGYGGRVQATLAVAAGQQLHVFVAGAGGQCPDDGVTLQVPGGFNGGGGAICGITNSAGGGATDIRLSPLLSDRILVAGGGGGAGGPSGAGCTSGSGGLGGGVTGGDAPICMSGGPLNNAGLGGTPTMGGKGGDQAGTMAESGGFGVGGTGLTAGGFGAGGGGAGWWGGGAALYVGGGGGGSSYVKPEIASNVAHTQGTRWGNGQITIRW
jgi:hypothetical protein